MQNSALNVLPTVKQGSNLFGNLTITKQILYSSLYAMMHDCPHGHGKKGHPCKSKYHDMMETVVCIDRRALEPITKPHQYVVVQFTRDGVRVV